MWLLVYHIKQRQEEAFLMQLISFSNPVHINTQHCLFSQHFKIPFGSYRGYHDLTCHQYSMPVSLPASIRKARKKTSTYFSRFFIGEGHYVTLFWSMKLRFGVGEIAQQKQHTISCTWLIQDQSRYPIWPPEPT